MSPQVYAPPQRRMQSSASKSGGLLHRKCDSCEKKRLLQRSQVVQSDHNKMPANMQEILRSSGDFSGVKAQTVDQVSNTGRMPFPLPASGASPDTKTPLYAPMPIPSNTVHCVKKWTPCTAPYSPGSWAAKVSYHCPVLAWPIILPGTTQFSYVTVPDEFIGVDPSGADKYRCRPGFQVRFMTDIGDTVATALNRKILYPDQQSCHVGYRRILRLSLETLFKPSGGGRPAGIRVNGPPPPATFPCP